MNTVNVIEMDTSTTAIQQLVAYSDDEFGNAKAEQLFKVLVRKHEDGISDNDIEIYLEDGYWEDGYHVAIVHSTTSDGEMRATSGLQKALEPVELADGSFIYPPNEKDGSICHFNANGNGYFFPGDERYIELALKFPDAWNPVADKYYQDKRKRKFELMIADQHKGT